MYCLITIDIDNDFDPEVVKETKEATLAQSINTLNKGLQEANVPTLYMNVNIILNCRF